MKTPILITPQLLDEMASSFQYSEVAKQKLAKAKETIAKNKKALRKVGILK
jgi:hypothetical protein